jgi:hypothetical protein
MSQERIIDSLIQENKSISKIVDSLQIQNQIEKLVYKVDTQNSIINEVNAFYDSAWIKLILVITFLGIVVPIIVQYYQRRNFKELTEDLKEKFDSKLDNLKENNDERINLLLKKHKKKITRIEKKNEKSLFELEGTTFYLQGRTLFIEKNYYMAFGNFLRASLFLKRCGKIDRTSTTLDFALTTLKKLTKEELEKVNNEMIIAAKNVHDCIIEIEKEISSDSVIIGLIEKIRDILNKEKSA